MIKKNGIILISFLSFLVASCHLINPKPQKDVIARVNDSYLYKEDITSLITENTSKEDSAFFVSNYIERWATQKLLIERAKVNLNSQQQEDFGKLVQNYKNELYTKAYTDAIISRQLDTAISMAAVQKYYEQNGENFKLSEDLVKLRYISMSPDNNNRESITQKFRQFKEEDKKNLLDMAIQFNSYSLNDSVWVKAKQVYDKIAPLTPENNSGLLKKENFLQLKDSLRVYLIFVEDVKLRNEQAPLRYSMPTIKQILLNKRKLELIKKLEKDITQDALKNEQFEIYK